MQTVVLNGADLESPTVDALSAEVERQLANRHDTVRTFHLRDFAIGHCLGEFDCWVKTPGRCRIHDEGQEIERAVHDAELLVLLTPLRFGGYGPQLKKAVDRLLPLVTPYFEKRADLTHHQHRYERMPHIVAIGWDAAPSAARERLFHAFVESNALNLGSPAWGAALVGDDPGTWGEPVARALAASALPGNASASLEEATRVLHETMRAEPAALPFAARPTVAILVASARAPGTSTSESLARYLGQQLQRGGAKVQVVSATAFARDHANAERTARQLADADVLVVASPLYFDSLPYLGVLALQQVRDARHAERGRRPARLVGLLNCGFPEPEQLRFALALLREFAREAGYSFAGALPVGGGEAIHGRPLDSTGGMTRHLRAALDDAAASLAWGEMVPAAASEQAARLFIPAPLFRLAGWWGWRTQAHAHHLRAKDLRAAPFDAIDDAEWQRMAASGRVPARPLRVIEKIPEGADAVTLVFDDPARHAGGFEAGQYLTLEMPIDGDRVRRAYSLSGAPCDAQLSITVKRVPGGLASNWIHDHLSVGALVRSFGPSGSFTPGPRPTAGPRRLLLIAGGSGIVPLAVIAREILHTERDAEVALIYGSASLARAIFAAPLRHLAEEYAPRFALQFVFETPPPGWAGAQGRLDTATLGACLQRIDLGAFQRAMLCGPDGMRAAARQALCEHGFPAERMAEESFTSPRRASVPRERQIATLLGSAGSQTLPVNDGQTLLEAALDAGVPISFSCCSGGCGACRVRITEHLDSVLLDEPNDISAEDCARGEVPACLVRLRGPVGFSIP
jgi:ferredoxin-NADP reductase/multimeric flavodoxin WrbA